MTTREFVGIIALGADWLAADNSQGYLSALGTARPVGLKPEGV